MFIKMPHISTVFYFILCQLPTLYNVIKTTGFCAIFHTYRHVSNIHLSFECFRTLDELKKLKDEKGVVLG